MTASRRRPPGSSGAPLLRSGPPSSVEAGEAIVHEGEGDLVASFANCVVVVLERTFTTLAANAVGTEMSRIIGHYGRVNYISLISNAKLRQQHGTRAVMANVVRRYTKSITSAAIVCEGTGFRPTVVRSAITRIHMASLASHPLRVFSTLDPALAWLLERQPEHDLDIVALGHSVGTLRARLRERAP